jgi:hypothetical protein
VRARVLVINRGPRPFFIVVTMGLTEVNVAGKRRGLREQAGDARGVTSQAMSTRNRLSTTAVLYSAVAESALVETFSSGAGAPSEGEGEREGPNTLGGASK